MREALYYEARPEGGVFCRLCPQNCFIGAGKTGLCRVRKNYRGKLYTENYAACTSLALDPVEKKPLYHFYPGAYLLSLGTWGCNFTCQFCQNWEIAQARPAVSELPPATAVALAVNERRRGNIGLAFTYSEPNVWYEYVLDTAALARQQGLKTVLVTNGFINEQPLTELLPVIDALNIDVKAFNDEFYRRLCAGKLADVQRTVERAAGSCHVEVTTLIIPGLNDRETELAGLAKWLAGIDREIPLHLSRYFPNYKLALPPTPPATMNKAYKTVREYLSYVYLGNAGPVGINTNCPVCGQEVIDRQKRLNRLTAEKKCPRCGNRIKISGEIKF